VDLDGEKAGTTKRKIDRNYTRISIWYGDQHNAISDSMHSSGFVRQIFSAMTLS
jgi:hypothetical protein